MAQLTFPVLGVLDNTPDSVQKDFKFQVARNNGRGRIELKTSKDRGVTYKVLVPEIISSTTAGSILTVQDDGSAEWSRPKSNLVTVNGATLTVNRTMNLTGTSGTTYNLDDILINPGEVTLAMMANIDASAGVKVVGRSTASNGVPQVLSTSGTGNVAMTVSPTFTGTLAAAAVTATSINGITITAGGSGTLTIAGSINTSSSGGVINTSSNGGNINTSSSGGNINTSAGGGIDTANGGGSITTSGSGSIGLGNSAANTMTTLTGAASGMNKSIALPNASGTLVLNDNTATITNKSIVATQLTGNVDIARIATALETPGAIGGTTASTGAFTTLTGTSSATLGTNGGTGGSLVLRGSTSGTATINTSATGVLALPSGTTATSMALTTPVLGTPTSGTLTNCTGLPVSGITASTTTAIGVGSIDLGDVSDTTIQRVSAGVISVEGVTMLSQTNTLTGITNKTFTAPVLGAATATSINGITISAGGSGTLTMAGSINTGVGGGSITTAGYGVTNGGSINLSSNAGGYGGSLDMSASVSASGGSISTHSGGGSINTTNGGGNIDTSAGGGSITTSGNGSIGLGIVANRTYLVSTAGNNEKTATFPNVTGTVAVASTSATATEALFATATAGAPAYRAITSGDITPSAPTARAALTGPTNVIAYSVGTKQSATMTAAATISSFTGGSDGATLELWVKGGASDFVLKCTPPAASDSLIDLVTTGKTITANKIWVLGFKYFANITTPGWRLVSLVGGF